MKKLKIFCLSLLLLLATCSVAQAAQIEVWFFPNESGYGKNMVSYTMDATSFVQDNRMYVPVRYLAESLGFASGNIDYKDSVVTLKGDIEVKLVIGESAIYINGVKKDIDVAPVIRDSRTYLPARYIAEAFGFNVEWDGVKAIITGEELVGKQAPGIFSKTLVMPGSVNMPDGDWYSFSQFLITLV
jgi:N-acetylmuramoyl-L-alanine amidase